MVFRGLFPFCVFNENPNIRAKPAIVEGGWFWLRLWAVEDRWSVARKQVALKAFANGAVQCSSLPLY